MCPFVHVSSMEITHFSDVKTITGLGDQTEREKACPAKQSQRKCAILNWVRKQTKNTIKTITIVTKFLIFFTIKYFDLYLDKGYKACPLSPFSEKILLKFI